MKETRKAYSLALVALLTLSAYFLADTVDAMIGRSLDAAPTYAAPIANTRPPIEPRREMSDYASVLERGLFGEGKGPSNAPAAADAVNYKLIGTVEGDVFAGAVLEDATGQVFYRIHQQLPDGSQIIKVLHDRVTLRRADGTTADIQIVDDTKIVSMVKAGPGVRRIGDGKFAIDQREMQASTENMSQLLTQARALPYVEQGKTIGFRITEIVPGSLYEKIGLVNGDVIQKINSQDVDDPGKFFQLYQGLKEEKNISIDLVRGGQRQSLNYEIR
ncbi:MAG TPA: type II secretion system protein N [Nitrospirota bacterium]|nr:type II secretion system protein N [Nitrospirota bacterium]